MFNASLNKILPTTITGSLPRPSWYTENLGIKSFLDAMVTSRFREQYVDALSVYLREQEVAGLDIVTDGDCRFDQDVGGQSWTSYPPHHMSGFDATHLTFLHGGENDASRRIVASLYEVIPTDFGFVVGTGRDRGDGTIMWNMNVMLSPFHKIISSVPHAVHVWVPIDDENTMLYSVDFHPSRPLTEQDLARSKAGLGIHTENVPGTDHAVRSRANDYLIDRALQASGKSYTGMMGFGTQDCAIQESMGPIADRACEHLLASDAAIVKIRRLLLQTLKDHAAGKPLPGMNPANYRVRSGRFEAKKGIPFADAMAGYVRLDTPIAAE